MSKKKILLSIVIPVFNNWSVTKSCLNDLIKLPPDHEIIIIDNGSTDQTPNKLKEEVIRFNKLNTPSLSVFVSSKNLGFGRANNRAYVFAKGDCVLFLNNDIYIPSSFKTWTKRLIEKAKKGYLVAAQGGLLDNNFNFVCEGNIDLRNKLSYLSGWCLCGSKNTFNKLFDNKYTTWKGREKKYDYYFKLIDPSPFVEDQVYAGPFNPRYFLYFEDTDLSFRAREMGISLKLVTPPISHMGRVTGKQLDIQQNYLNSKEIFMKNWKDKICQRV